MQNINNAFGDTPLHIAIRSCNYSLTKEILETTPDAINVANQLGDTPLHIACGTGCFDIMKLLIDRGADKETMNTSGFRPIHCAAEGGHLKSIQMLIAAGVDIDSLTAHGASSLSLVPQPESSLLGAAVFGWLLAHGASYDIYAAVTYGMSHVVSAMLNENACTWQDQPRASKAIVKACGIFFLTTNLYLKNKRINLVRNLLEHRANPNEVADGISPLLAAIRNNDEELVELLISHGADVNMSVENCSPLQMAEHLQNEMIINTLRRHGAFDKSNSNSCQYPF